MFDLSYKYSLNIKAGSRPDSATETIQTTVTPLDPLLFFCVLFAACCTMADWLLSKDEKRRIKQRIGDYWTTIQGVELHSLFATVWEKYRKVIVSRFASQPWSINSLFWRCTIHGLLLYITWRIAIGIAAQCLGLRDGGIFTPPISVTLTPNLSFGILLTLWWIAISWLTWQGFSRALQHTTFSKLGIAIFLLLSIATSALVVSTSLIFLNEVHDLTHFIERFHKAFIPSKVDVTVEMADNSSAELFEYVLAALLGKLIDALDILVVFLLLIVFLATTIGPLLLLSLTVLSVALFHYLLARLSFIVKPIVSRILNSLYESERGTFTQIGLFIAAAVKLTDEATKRLF
jgi:hypothetical protein